jgi:hypothetical protein
VANSGSDYFSVKKNSKWNLQSLAGVEILPPRYDDSPTTVWKGEVATYKIAGKRGAYDIKQGKELLPARYDSLRPLDANRWLAKEGNVYHLIDDKGQAVTPQEFTNISEGRNEFLFTTKTGGGIADYNGNALYGPQIGNPYYLFHHNNLFRDKDSGVSALIVESAAHRWGRRASVLYAENATANVAMLVAAAIFGWWLVLIGGENTVLAQIGRAVRFFPTLGIGLWVLLHASDFMAARVPAYKSIHDDWIGPFILGALFCGIALYLYRRWGHWHPSARWFFMAAAWPILVFFLIMLLERTGLERLANNDTFGISLIVLGVGVCLGMSIYAGRALWQRKAAAT